MYTCMNNSFEVNPITTLVMVQKSPLNKDFVELEFFLKFDLLNRFESEEFEEVLTKPPLSWKMTFFDPVTHSLP